jgi:hypothetical protein
MILRMQFLSHMTARAAPVDSEYVPAGHVVQKEAPEQLDQGGPISKGRCRMTLKKV